MHTVQHIMTELFQGFIVDFFAALKLPGTWRGIQPRISVAFGFVKSAHGETKS